MCVSVSLCYILLQIWLVLLNQSMGQHIKNLPRCIIPMFFFSLEEPVLKKGPTILCLVPNPTFCHIKELPPLCMCCCSRSSLIVVCVRRKGLGVCQAPQTKVLLMGTSAESNSTNFLPSPILSSGFSGRR